MSNPLHNVIKKVERKIYPITVKCVVDDLSIITKDLIAIRDYSHSLNIVFVTREYDSSKYSDDRHYIERLPAFHIYVNTTYKKTFYPNTRPYQIIQQTLEKYIRRLEQIERNKDAWYRFFNNIIERMKKLVHRKTRMEAYAEEKKKDNRVREWS
jgi:hypothetical protein